VNPTPLVSPPGGTPGRTAATSAKESPVQTTYTVSGMTCGHCVNSVRAEVSQIPGVTEVNVDLASGAVTVTSGAPLDEAELRAAVDEAGYALAG
jgi:copper chaperone